VVVEFQSAEGPVMTMDVLAAQLAAIRAQAVALITVIDIVANPEPVAASVVPVAPVAPAVSVEEGDVDSKVCTHPVQHQVAAGTMGNIGRKMCGCCGEEITL
jgi:hypothetical protein